MHVHVGILELFVFILYYILTKAIFLIVNLELRRNQIRTPAAVSGLLS